MIVITCSSLFFFSMLFGRERGVLIRIVRRLELNRSVDRQHLLRGMFELLEARSSNVKTTGITVTFSELLAMRTLSSFRLLRQIERCRHSGLLVRNHNASLSLTDAGLVEAARLVHEHRLWEIYLITHADVAPGRVDQAADAIEHVLEPELIAQLEQLLAQERTLDGVVASPHPLKLESIVGGQASQDLLQANDAKGRLP